LSLPVARALYVWLGGFALFALLTTLIREIVKDLQDQTGDRELECHTLPIVIGDTWTKTMVTLLIAATIALLGWFWWSVLPFERAWNSLSTRYILFGIVVPLLCETALLWSAKIPSDYRAAQTLMKFVMFIGMLYGFVISNTL
jgi:4-hydroxybenzoate polyprenyltransferase